MMWSGRSRRIDVIWRSHRKAGYRGLSNSDGRDLGGTFNPFNKILGKCAYLMLF
jgi:hypothetical protein